MTQRRTALAGVIAGSALGLVGLLARARARRAVSFKGRVVLITGGSRGLGLELAREFAREGARLALLARDEAELLRAQDDLAAAGARVLIVPADVRDREEVEGAVRRIVTHYGRLDVVVNSAGIISVGPIDHMSLDDFEQAIRVHYWGPLHVMLAALPHLRRVKGARIVNISSIGGKVAVPHLAPYSGSKFALAGLSDAFRAELAPLGIRVTTVCPGLMRTGSPINATFKGRHHEEFSWFTLGDSLPGLSVSSKRAARAIVGACRTGAPSLVIGVPAKLAAATQGVTPFLVAFGAAIAARLLPRPDEQAGTEGHLGWQSQSRVAPSVLTRLSDRAAVRNNEATPALPIGASTTPATSVTR